MPSYLVVVLPPAPKARGGVGSDISSWTQPTPPTVRVESADSEEEALEQVSIPAGSRVYAAPMDNVHEYEIPDKPKPIRVDRGDTFF